MLQQRSILLFTCILPLLLGACGAKDVELSPAVSRPVKLFSVLGGEQSALRVFPGKVDAAQRADVGFRVSGQLEAILVREGDVVIEGQELARLDPADFEIVLEDRQATFDNSESNFTRGKELIVDGNISRRDYDRMEAEFRSASAALSQAQKDMEYTILTAPFSGRIAQRMVENFEDVLGKQTIFRVQNVGELDVVIDMPEALIRSFNVKIDDENLAEVDRTDTIRAVAQFEGRAGAEFPLTLKEVATKADMQTQTFKTTFAMTSPKNFTVLPGMTVNVSVNLAGLVAADTAKWVPVRAVQADSALNSRVWVLDKDSMTVSSQAVSVGRMSGNRIEVLQGLQGGEDIVSVGAPYLSEGMRVSQMASGEQAVPRADDPS